MSLFVLLILAFVLAVVLSLLRHLCCPYPTPCLSHYPILVTALVEILYLPLVIALIPPLSRP